MWKRPEGLWKENLLSNVTLPCGKKNIILENTNKAFITYAKKRLIILPLILLSTEFLSAQETLNVPSYYGGTGTNNQAVQSNNLQNQQQNSIQNYQNLVSNIQINQDLISQLSESNEVVANPNTGEVRTVGTNDPTPSGWMRLDVTPTDNGYTLGNNSQGGQFSYSIQSQPTMTQFQPSTVVNPNTFQVANSQQQTPGFTYNPNTVSANGAQTTVTNNSQTNVGNTTIESMVDGSTVTSTPTETVDQQVTTIVTPDSETIITETTTTTVTESLIQGPTIITEGGGATYATQSTPVQQASQAQQYTQQPVNSSTDNQNSTMTAVGTPPLVMNETGGNTVMATPTSPAINNASPQATFYTAPNPSGSQTTVTNNTQTNVGETTSQTLGNGTTITETPTETVDTTVTTTTTPNSQTIITETVTTNTIDGVIETPGTVINNGSPAIASNTTNGTVITPIPDVNLTPSTSGAVPVPYPTSATTNDTGTGSTKETVNNTEIAVQGSGPSNGTTSSPTFELGGDEEETTGIQQNYELPVQSQEIDVGLSIQQDECQGPDCPPTNTEGSTSSADNDTSINTASDENEATEEETNVADASTSSDTEGDASDATEEGEGADITDSSSPATVMANNVNSSSGISQAEREAAAARAAEEERRRREEYIRMQQEASNLRQGSQNRAMALLENDSTAMMDATSAQMGGSSGMMDPHRMSIFSQNARFRAGNTAANLSPQIASLSNTIASVNKGLNDGEVMGGLPNPCPAILGNACDEAADRAAKLIEEEVKKARDKARKEAEKDLDGLDEDIDEGEKKAKEEQEERDNRTDREKRRDALEEEQRERAERLQEEADRLEEEGKRQKARREQLERDEGDLRRQEQEARRNGDPNCRGPVCQGIREQRQANSRATSELARQEGMLQRDQSNFQGAMREFRIKQEEIDELWQGDPVYEAKNMQADAHDRARRAQSEADRLREEQLNLRRQGGSGSRQDRAYDRAIERAQRNADAAAADAATADKVVLKAQFYEAGMQNEWKEYENAREASNAFNGFLNAERDVKDLAERRNAAQDAFNAAEQDNDFDADSLESLEKELADLNEQLDGATRARDQFRADIGTTTEALTGTPMSATNATSQALTDKLRTISSDFSERQRLSRLTDSELQTEIDMLGEAKQRVAAARGGLDGNVQDPGGALTDRYNELTAQRKELQDRIDNFNPGGIGTGVVFGADQAYRDMQTELSRLDGEIDKMTPIAAADSAFDRVVAHNEWSDGLLDGFPIDSQGNIDRMAFREQVAEVAQLQMDFVQANNNLQQARGELEEAISSGDLARVQQAQINFNQMEMNVGNIANQFELRDINIMVSPDGEFSLDVENIGASATWSAAAEGVSKFETDRATARAQLASARGASVPDAASGVVFGPPQQSDTNSNTVGGTAVREFVEVRTVEDYTPPIDPTGGFIGPLQLQEQRIVEQRRQATAGTVARNSQPPATVEQLVQATATAKEAAKQKFNQARSVARDAEEAKYGVETAEQEAEFRRDLAEGNAGTRVRQANEYVELAESAAGQADGQRDRAKDLEDQAARLRASAERNQRLADNTDDESLASAAQTAADNNRTDASAREEEARGIRSEAARDDERAERLATSGQEAMSDADQLRADADQAELDAENARREAVRLDAEVLRLTEEGDQLIERATATSTELARLQTNAFNELMKNPPEGWRWSDLDSSQRSDWLNKNIPQWDTLNTAQRIDFLERLELGEARKDFIDQNARYKEFNESSQGQRSTPEMLESRGRDLARVQARIKELDDMTYWTDEEEAEHKMLKEGLETGVARLRSDQRARRTEETLRYDTWQEANRKLWAADDTARAEEVQKQVNTYVEALERVETAKNMAAARNAAFNTREIAIQDRIDNPTSAQDAEAARGELVKLAEARKFWSAQDESTVRVTQTFANEVRDEVTHFGTMNGLGEIGFDDQLEARAAMTRVSTAVMGAMLGLPPQPDQTASIKAAVNGLDFKEPAFDPYMAMINGYDATAKAVSDIGVSFGVAGGLVYGTGEGVVKGVVGIADVFIIEPLDTFFETLEIYAEDLTGTEIDVFGTDNLDFINSLGGGSPGDLVDLGVKFAVSQGKKVSEGVDRVENAYATGSITDGFTGTSDIASVGAELFIDPTLAFAGVTKVASVLRAVDKVDDIAHAGSVLDDVARGLDAAGDVTRSGAAAQEAARTGEVVGDSVRFADRAHAGEASGAYQGLDELLGPEFAGAFGTTPRAPVFPPARPTAIPTAGNAPRTPLAPRDGPYQGLDELLGPEFRNALDDLPGAPLDGLAPYQGLDELLGPEFASALGAAPRPPVYPPLRNAPLPARPAGAPPLRPAPAPDGPFQGLDELLGPEFRNAFDDAPGVPRDGPSPYQGLDEILGPEFSQAFGTTPRSPVYPPPRTPLAAGGPSPRSPSSPTGLADGPYQGLDELLGPDFRNALDEPLSVGRTGPGDTLPIPRDGPGGTMPIPRDGPGGTMPIPRDGPGGTLPVPRDGPGGTLPVTRNGPGGTAPLAANGPNGIPPTIRDGIPPTIRDGIPPTNGPRANPAANNFAANNNAPLGAGRGPTGTLRNGPVPPAGRGPTGTLPDGPAGGAGVSPGGGGGVPPTGGGAVPPGSGGGIPPTNAPRGPQPIGNAIPDSNPPLAVGQAGSPVNVLPVQIPSNPAPIVAAKQYGDVIVVHLQDGSSFSLAKGETLGAGSFTEVSALRGANEGRVLKEAKDLAGALGIPVEEAAEIANIAARLDKVGTDGLRALPKWVQDNIIYTPEVFGEFKVIAANDNIADAARIANDAGELSGKSLRVAERAPVPTYADAKGWQTPMSPSEVNAFNRAQQFTNEGGLVIFDIKSNNFGFQDLVNGIKRTMVHDNGGVLPTIGSTAAERAANAKTIQRALLTPDEALVTSFKNASAEVQRFRAAEAEALARGDATAALNARRGANAASERMFDITTGHGQRVMERYGGLLDMDKIQVPLDKIPFNPTLGFTQDGVRAANRANAARVANDNTAGLGNAASGG